MFTNKYFISYSIPMKPAYGNLIIKKSGKLDEKAIAEMQYEVAETLRNTSFQYSDVQQGNVIIINIIKLQ